MAAYNRMWNMANGKMGLNRIGDKKIKNDPINIIFFLAFKNILINIKTK